ncbi:MAG: ComEC/Rec2 family competence protein, partial [Clostridia bacterium]|nr:ComEC/Rec2 family competence protein [Clostridia bacterium]
MIIKKSFMPFLAIFSITGIYIGTSYEKITSYILFLLLLLFYLYINIKENKYSIKYKIAVTSFLVLFFIFFYIYSSVYFSAIDNNNIHNDKKSIRIIGYVKNLNEINEKELKFTINCTDGFNYNVVLSDINDNSSINTGDIYIIEGKLYKPQKATNKGQFDYQKYCYSKNVTATIYSDYENITNIGKKTILYKIGILRNKAVKRASMNLSKQEKNISVALITGGSEHIDNEIDLLFRKSGLSHLLSISGTHFSILILP